MANQSLRTVLVKYSITNPEITNGEYRDTITPLSFLDFINNTQADYTPEEYSSSYSSYLQAWHSNQQGSEEEQKEQFKDYYRQFIKEIVINYTTETEKRFLEKINFNDPADLDVAIPFFANRLKDIALFYKKKRDEGKYVIDRNKLKGSKTGLEKAIFDNIYNFTFNTEDALIPAPTDVIAAVTGLGIEIEEYVDVYGDYFDVPSTGESDNINKIDTKYWLDPAGITAITGEKNFLNNLRTFKINPPAITPEEFDAICNPDNALVQAENQHVRGGLTVGQFYSLKRALIAKYIGTDIHYIDTRSTTNVTGRLITAENPTGNALNLQGADTATVESNQTKLLRDVGLNFKPDDIGLFKLQAENFSYEINLDDLEDDQFYIFPDPSRFGNVSTNPKANYPIYYKFDNRGNTRNVSSGIAAGDPKITNKVTTIESYTTKERNNTQLAEHNDISYKLNFTDLFNQGIVDKYQTDIFGNEYALFKEESVKPINDEASTEIKNLLLNGHVFFDQFEGYNFNFSLTGVSGNTFKSGLTSTTNGFTDLNGPLTMYMREFYPYQELIQDTRNIIPFWRDGGSFTFLDSSALPDPASGDANYYYTVLAEGTFPDDQVLTTEQTPLSDITSEADFLIITEDSSANFTQDIRYYLSAGDPYTNYDGGYFADNIELPNDFNYTDNLRFIDAVDPAGSTVLSDLSSSTAVLTREEKKSLDGRLYVKNGTYSTSEPVSAALKGLVSKYSTAVQDQVNHELVDFDIIQNTIFLETKSNLIVDKIVHTDGKFVAPTTVNTFFSVNSANSIETFTNRFYVENTGKVYFARFKSNDGTYCSDVASNFKAVYPEVYEYSITTNTAKKVYPDSLEDVSLSAFELNVANENIRNYAPNAVHTPKIAYNSRNNLFKITYIVNDMNDFTHMVDVSFKMENNKLSVIDSNRYETLNTITRTSTFGDNSTFGQISSTGGTFTKDTSSFTLTV
tara:strand:+ start:5545 stop:8442 length:2898 start_codon:yes stop_codon:yes gene_type:complete